MTIVKCWDNQEPQEFKMEFETTEESCKWIDDFMQFRWNELCNEYPNTDIVWLNRLLDCGNETTIYVPNTSTEIVCKLVENE